MNAFRLVRAPYADDLTGAGARKYGGRWNSPGTSVVYTASSRALAMLEVLAHLPFGFIPSDFQLVTLWINEIEADILEIKWGDLPKGWDQLPPGAVSREIGNRWISEQKYPVMKVPSALVSEESNLLLNPALLPGKVTISKIEDFQLDHRLLKIPFEK